MVAPGTRPSAPGITRIILPLLCLDRESRAVIALDLARVRPVPPGERAFLKSVIALCSAVWERARLREERDTAKPPVGASPESARRDGLHGGQWSESGPLIRPDAVGSAVSPVTSELLDLFDRLFPDVLYLYDTSEGRLIWINRKVSGLLGYTPAEMLPQGPGGMLALIHPEDVAAFSTRSASMEAEGFVAPGEHRAQHKDGSWRWLIFREAVLERDAAGRVTRVLGMAQDITGHKQREQQQQSLAERDHRIAEILQTTVQPTLPRETPGVEVFALSEPTSTESTVGGDFYDVFPVAGGRLAFVVGDVIGHGLEAALSIAEVRFALRGFLFENPDANPADTLHRLHRYLIQMNRLRSPLLVLTAGGGQRPSLVALTLALFDPASGVVRLSAAGVEPSLLARAATGAVETLDATDMLLGVDAEARYHVAEATLAPGDLLAILTDGIIEARAEDAPADQFGPIRLQRSLAGAFGDMSHPSGGDAASGGDLERVARSLIGAARHFAGGTLHDDACLLLARRTHG